MFATDDTIVAIATPAGPGGIGVVRVSGPSSTTIANSMLRRATPLKPRHATVTEAVIPEPHVNTVSFDPSNLITETFDIQGINLAT